MICAVCKYAPVELFAGFGEKCGPVSSMPADTAYAEEVAHANLCGFGKTVIQKALSGDMDALVLTNCCDVMRRSRDIIADGWKGELPSSAGEGGGSAPQRFLHLMDLPRTCGPCQAEQLAREIRKLRDAYAEHTGRAFDLAACQEACAGAVKKPEGGPYIGILGARVGAELEAMIARHFELPVRNLACVGSRSVVLPPEALATDDEGAFFLAYAQALLAQVPCMRMADTASRRALFEDPNLVAIVYHTMKFCDFYGGERAAVQRGARVPVLSLETDFTLQSAGQLETRIEAFAESLGQGAGRKGAQDMKRAGNGATGSAGGRNDAAGREAAAGAAAPGTAGASLFAGIDSGSTSTDVVIVDGAGEIVASRIIATGGGAAASAEACLAEALEAAGIGRTDLSGAIATGYGRDYLGDGEIGTVTEITCHARGARALVPQARCIIDIGGQDSKAIALGPDGAVANFVMNDKCAAGTGRFLEMMARALQLSLAEMSTAGLSWDEDIKISSMCSVFAESEVVSLVAQSKATADIVHGLNEAVASKTCALVRRVSGQGPFVMTGGVSKNAGVVAAIERQLGETLAVPESAQLAGALGAALIARDRAGR